MLYCYFLIEHRVTDKIMDRRRKRERQNSKREEEHSPRLRHFQQQYGNATRASMLGQQSSANREQAPQSDKPWYSRLIDTIRELMRERWRV